jgi:two-component system phosphate regulon sensor histidine kinase PhoR
MIARAFGLLICIASGAWFGHAFLPILFSSFNQALGASLGALVWMIWDHIQISRVWRQLLNEKLPQSISWAGIWNEWLEKFSKERRTFRQQLIQSNLRLQQFLSAIQASPNGVILLDLESRIEWCNLMAAQQLGIDVTRDHMQHIAHLVRDPTFHLFLNDELESHELVIDSRQTRVDFTQRISFQIFPYGEGRRLLLSRDVTQIEQAEAMRRDFVANVSHEIRTPLTVLAGFVETLQNLKLDQASQDEFLALMAQQAKRMQTLVEDLLTLSKLEGSPLPGMQELSPLQSIWENCMHNAISLSNTLYPEQKQIIDADTATFLQDLSFAGSSQELISAFDNLASNAVRYTPPGGSIHFGCVAIEGRMEFIFQDSGPGIAVEHLPRLTERFYRVDRSRSRETGGTGLGLAIVKHVAQRLGGELKIQSQLGVGSRFSFTLPQERIKLEVESEI